MPRLEFECQLSVPVDGYGTHKLNDSLLLPGAFAYWAGGRLSLCGDGWSR